MPASPPSQAVTPSYRTPVVLKAFCFGSMAGVLVTLGALFIHGQYHRLNTPGQGRNRADAIVIDNDGYSIVSASSCDVFRKLTGTCGASGPVRFRVDLVRVVDGDTIRVMWHGENLSVRLLGIDAPERGHAGGPESTECLRTLLAGSDTVDLEFENESPRRDSLGRLLAYVWRGDMLLNLEMVRRGRAGLYKGGGKGKHGDALRIAIRLRSTE